jgi:GDPmannose 4,6-dehydratase
MYNHESEFRDERIVTKKIITNLLRIKYSDDKSKFALGNINAMRDWGYSGDFVRAMWMILQHTEMEDFIISTNIMHSVRDFLLLAMDSLNLGSDVMKFVNIDKTLLRNNDLGNLQGDNSKIRSVLGWKPSLNLEQIIERMIKYNYNRIYGDKTFQL